MPANSVSANLPLCISKNFHFLDLNGPKAKYKVFQKDRLNSNQDFFETGFIFLKHPARWQFLPSQTFFIKPTCVHIYQEYEAKEAQHPNRIVYHVPQK